jgi:phosphotransferase system enzyme I (PtsP)
MLKANSGLGNLRVMLPMISNVSEFDEARALLVRAYSEVLEEGWAVRMPQVGVMIEVPAAVYQAGVLARRADFLSVGTNDLTQYLLAVDRNNARVANLYHAFHPAVLHALMDVVDAAHRAGKPASVCGELAGDPGAALLLVGMGYDSLSMSAPNLARVKSVLRRFTRAQAAELVRKVSRLEDAREVKAAIEDRLRQEGVVLRAGA